MELREDEALCMPLKVVDPVPSGQEATETRSRADQHSGARIPQSARRDSVVVGGSWRWMKQEDQSKRGKQREERKCGKELSRTW